MHAAADAKSAVLANVVLLDAQVEALIKALIKALLRLLRLFMSRACGAARRAGGCSN